MPGGLLGIEPAGSSRDRRHTRPRQAFQPRQTDTKKSDQLQPDDCDLFFEASTRTRTSFEIAAKRLTTWCSISPSRLPPPASQGKSLVDALNPGRMQHHGEYAMRRLALPIPGALSSTPIINAGDGTHERPPPGAVLGRPHHSRPPPALEGLRVAVARQHARGVARSNMYLLSKFGAQIVLCGPASLLPPELAQLAPGVGLTHKMEDAIRDADVIMMCCACS